MRKGYYLYLGILEYDQAFALQQELNLARQQGKIPDTLIILEHHPCFTVGRKGGFEHILVGDDILNDEGIRVYETDRGGDITYHGPGQLVCYPIIDLKNYGKDLHVYARSLEEVVICTLKTFGIEADRKKEYPGVWAGASKIAAEGIMVNRWVTMHGTALNVNTNMRHFMHIIPCGISNFSVTSMEILKGHKFNMELVRQEMCRQFSSVFEIELQEIAPEEMDDFDGKTRLVNITSTVRREVG